MSGAVIGVLFQSAIGVYEEFHRKTRYIHFCQLEIIEI